jgi:hypothetical protein
MRSSPPRPQAIALLVAFGVQFALGMLLNLFVELPKTHPGSTGDEYFSRSFTSLGWALSGGAGPALLIHAWLALVLALGTLALFVRCLAGRVRGWRWLTGIAALFTVGAFFNGMSFVDYGEDFSSAIMAGCWLIAVSLLVTAVVRRPREGVVVTS